MSESVRLDPGTRMILGGTGVMVTMGQRGKDSTQSYPIDGAVLQYTDGWCILQSTWTRIDKPRSLSAEHTRYQRVCL